ncbi:hypothetical protein DFO67_10467 [Modicisalibacter xianhensis]|uniref:Uncharacterized protein n=1 Tax=Modicisalibacter xianhensis TaxID=442341 RepID=A0A4R8FVF6_9GAMM|nr:hypothetical protein [Halomonas xianhensis]TDX30812.1 hypothetical protein DFO67_10467 [Halomonas xianhensis]
MSEEFYCPTCSEKWNGAFNSADRCTTCGDPIRILRPFEAGRQFAADVERMAEVGDE